MTKVLVNSQGKVYMSNGKALLSATSTIQATNNTGATINAGDKVWINTVNNSYSLVPYYNSESTYSNFTIYGSPTINQSTGVVSSFSSTKYLQLPQAFPSDQPWEMFIKFTTGNLPSYTWQGILGTNGQGGLPFYIVPTTSTEREFYAYFSSNGSSWDIYDSAILTATANTTYKMKAEYTGSVYNYYIYENNEWSLFFTISNSTPFKTNMNLLIGKYNSDYFRGSVDLSETYINVNGSLWWSPLLKTRNEAITENTITGIAAETITANSIGSVAVVL